MENAVIALVLLAVVIPVAIGISRANELFVIRVARGKASVVRGGVPARLLVDIRDVVGKPALEAATLHVRVENGRPMLRASGRIADGQLQRLRNVVGLWTKEQIRSARRV